MAQDMRGRSWRSLAAARLAPIKDYLAQRPSRSDSLSSETGYPDSAPKRPSWSQRLTKRTNSDSDDVATTERVVLLPGWASKRYHPSSNRADAPYDIEIFVSGYVVKHKTSNTLSRSQRTILRLAKSFASLPKLPDPYEYEDNLPSGSQVLSKSTEDLLAGIELPPRPDDITPEWEKRALRHPQQVTPSGTPTPSRPSSPSFTPAHSTSELPSVRSLKSVTGVDVLRWHTNLETRLRPFWAGVLSNRTLRVSVRPYFDLTGAESPSEKPLAEELAITDVNGSFKIRISIPWDILCTLPRGAPIAFVNTTHEQDLSVAAELMPPPSRPETQSEFFPPATPPPSLYVPTATAEERVPLTHCPIRVISDIDDTVKMSGVTRGARIVFHNVFVKDLEENVIPGMGEWYTEMWRRGVRFHYVSNGPFELLPVINDFFQLAQLPAGSVRLRSYGTRSLFSGLLSAPADRKRDGVVEVLKSFPLSQFILIGDSGEQDLELYANVAREYPQQIRCIFIRDVNTYEDSESGIEDPTGVCVRDGRITAQDLQTKRKGSSGGQAPRDGRWSPRSMSSQLLPPSPAVSRASSGSTDDTIPALLYGSGPTENYMDPLSPEPGCGSMSQPLPPCIARLPNSESDKQRLNLQIRVWRACIEVPPSIVFRVFREPQECVEAFQTIG